LAVEAGDGILRKGVEVGVVADDAGVVGHDAGGAELVCDVESGGGAGGEHGNALAAKENVLGGGSAGGVGLGEDFVARSIPVEFAIGFGDATAIGIPETRPGCYGAS
jgi:hypothetical protein